MELVLGVSGMVHPVAVVPSLTPQSAPTVGTASGVSVERYLDFCLAP